MERSKRVRAGADDDGGQGVSVARQKLQHALGAAASRRGHAAAPGASSSGTAAAAVPPGSGGGGEPSSSGRDRIDTDDAGNDDEALLAAVPSALMTALLVRRARVQRTAPGLPPVVLKTQLSAASSDASILDRELDTLRRDNTIRMFKLTTGPDEHAVLLTRDYTALVMGAASRQLPTRAGHPVAAAGDLAAQSNASGAALACSATELAARAFCDYVLPRHVDVHISHTQLVWLMATCQEAGGLASRGPAGGGGGGRGVGVGGRRSAAAAGAMEAAGLQRLHGASSSGRTGSRAAAAAAAATAAVAAAAAAAARPLGEAAPPDEQVSLLMQLGVISRHPDDPDTYLLTVPGLGPVVKAIGSGRREVQGLLVRKKYHEAPEQQLVEKAKLRSTPMGVAFHIEDMLGLGLVQRMETTVGPIIRLLKQRQ